MPRNNNIVLSDDELDELASGDELDLDIKPEDGPFGGAITKPRHVTISCKNLHGEYLGVSCLSVSRSRAYGT
jgi:hypothetical protein